MQGMDFSKSAYDNPCYVYGLVMLRRYALVIALTGAVQQELIYFCGIWLDQNSQYRWYQVIYQLGVFVSRSSVNVIRIKTVLLPLLAVLQFGNLALFFCEAYFMFIPSIWIIFAMIFYEGLLGGAAYVNTFYQIRQEVDPRYVEFSLGVASVADSSGILIAGLSAIPVHNWVCKQPLPHRLQ